jgi:hypothetical protein
MPTHWPRPLKTGPPLLPPLICMGMREAGFEHGAPLQKAPAQAPL